jgi:hypothetical protein
MLEGLEQVEWATGKFNEVPDWLKQLASDNQLSRRRAFNNIEEKILYGNQSSEDVD